MNNFFIINLAKAYGWEEKDFYNSIYQCLKRCSGLKEQQLKQLAGKVLEDIIDEKENESTECYLLYVRTKYRLLTDSFYRKFVKETEKLFKDEDMETLYYNYFLRNYNKVIIADEDLQYCSDSKILNAIDKTKLNGYVLLDGNYQVEYITKKYIKQKHSLKYIAEMAYADLINNGKNFKFSSLYKDLSYHSRFYLDRLIIECLTLHRIIFKDMKGKITL